MPAVTIAFVLFVAVATLVALSDWRKGLFLILVVAVLQDPIRKLTPGTSSLFVLSIVPVFGGIVLGLVQERRWWTDVFVRSEPKIAGALQLFAVWLLVPIAVGVFRYGTDGLVLGALGILSYGVAIVAAIVGFNGGLDSQLMRRIAMVFCGLTSCAMVGVWLEVSGVRPNWKILGTEVLDMEWVRHVTGRIIEMRSGFYRSPDLLGWHSTVAAMLALALSFSSRHPAARMFWLIVAAWTLVGTYYCGRRKFFYVLPIFFAAWMWCKRRRAGDFGVHLLGLGTVAVLFFVVVLPRVGSDDNINYYYFTSAGGETFERITDGGIGAVFETFRQEGILGGGLGSVSTGAHRAGFSGKSKKGWQESGSSRLAMELGLPGLLLAIWLGWLLLLRSSQIATDFGSSMIAEQQLYIGLFAAMAANFSSFFISHQVYGDPFVGFFTVFLAGALLGGRVQYLAVRRSRPTSSVPATVQPAAAIRSGGEPRSV